MQEVRDLLQFVPHIALATVNADGSPHNSVVFAASKYPLTFYWASTQETIHSQNIARTGQAFILVFKSEEGGQCVYVQTRVEVVGAERVPLVLPVFNHARQKLLRKQIPEQYFIDASPQRLYEAVAEKAWIHKTIKDKKGYIISDGRDEIDVSRLG